MAGKGWRKVNLCTPTGLQEGIAPVIISASRSTDIPAFYAQWFANRWQAGYVQWINPFNQKAQYISFQNTRAIIFWTKNPRPLLPFLKCLDAQGINYYFNFTLNDYEQEGWEPGVVELAERIDSFRRLADQIGKEKVIWRFDPLMLTDAVPPERLLAKVQKVGDQVQNHTEKLVISFADIGRYRRVQYNLRQAGINSREFSLEQMYQVAQGLQQINRAWGLEISTCAETVDLSLYGIKANHCIDGALLKRLFSHDQELMQFLAGPTSQIADQGQRKACGCIMSKDIGQYNTCNHGCIYCYANTSPTAAAKRYQAYLQSARNGASIVISSRA